MRNQRTAISDLVLKTAVGVRLEAGVAVQDIRQLIDRFAGDEAPSGENGSTIGFLGLEDIPPGRREAFLAELAQLAAPPHDGTHASVLTLQLAIDRLQAERQPAIDTGASERAEALLAEIEKLQEQKRALLRRIGDAAPWRSYHKDA